MVGQLARPQSEGERFLGALKESGPSLKESFQTAMKPGREEDENKRLKELTGKDYSGLSPDIKQLLLKGEMAGKGNAQQEQKQQAMTAGLDTIKEMRGLLKSAGPSNAFFGVFPGQTSKNRAQLAQLGRSLIPLASAGVSIRNQKEFDEYKKTLSDPNALQSELEGALDGLEHILQRQLGQSPDLEGGEAEMGGQEGGENQMVKVIPPGGGAPKLIPKSQVKAAMAAGGKVTR